MGPAKDKHQAPTDRIVPNSWPHYFIEYKALLKNIAVINHQYVDIHHDTNKKCDHILICFHFLFMCISVPYVGSGLCKFVNEPDN